MPAAGHYFADRFAMPLSPLFLLPMICQRRHIAATPHAGYFSPYQRYFRLRHRIVTVISSLRYMPFCRCHFDIDAAIAATPLFVAPCFFAMLLFASSYDCLHAAIFRCAITPTPTLRFARRCQPLRHVSPLTPRRHAATPPPPFRRHAIAAAADAAAVGDFAAD